MLSALIISHFLPTAHAGPNSTAVVRTQDVDLSYVTYGTADSGTPLVVVNGGPGFDHSYMVATGVWDRLAAHRKVIFYDQRGTGQSKLRKPDAPHTIEAYIADLDAIRAALHVAKMDLMGDSYGGFLSMAYADAHPEHIASLTLVDSMDPNWEETQVLFREVYPDRVPAEPDDAYWDQLIQSPSGLRLYLSMLFYSQDNFEKFMQAMPPTAGSSFPVYKAVNREQGGVKLRSRLSSFRFPCLVINGRFDPNVLPLTAWTTSQAIPGAKLVIFEKSGHLPFYEEPDKFVTVVDEFLAQQHESATVQTGAAKPWEGLPMQRALPALAVQGYVEHDGARIWYAELGAGSPVILLHGGLASSDIWGNQIPALITDHRRVILIDSRGHGRSTLGNGPLGYELMETDVIAVMNQLHIGKAAVVGWSDGAIIGLIMAMKHPARVSTIYAFGANMDTSDLNPGAFSSPVLTQLAPRLANEYARVSPTPQGFAALHTAVETMQKSQPNYSAAELATIRGPRVAIVDGDHEEFINRTHTEYLARTIPGAELILLRRVSHFAPWQAPEDFNRSMLAFLNQ
jgi:pimeloyl-ACP methyl ester carboxylesterase